MHRAAKLFRVDPQTGCTPLFDAAYGQDVRELQDMIHAVQSATTIPVAVDWINEPNHSGQTALHVAAACGNADHIKVLLESGADPLGGICDDGSTPLSLAALSSGDLRQPKDVRDRYRVCCTHMVSALVGDTTLKQSAILNKTFHNINANHDTAPSRVRSSWTRATRGSTPPNNIRTLCRAALVLDDPLLMSVVYANTANGGLPADIVIPSDTVVPRCAEWAGWVNHQKQTQAKARTHSMIVSQLKAVLCHLSGRAIFYSKSLRYFA